MTVVSQLGSWAQSTLALKQTLTLDCFDGAEPETVVFPSDCCVIDAQALEVIDSVGLAALIWLAAQAQAKQVELQWQQLPDALNELLALYELNNLDMIQEYAGTTN